jgi:hypothetical protein
MATTYLQQPHGFRMLARIRAKRRGPAELIGRRTEKGERP